jgi:hypothetical protein
MVSLMFTQLTAAGSGLSSDESRRTGRHCSFGADISDTTTLRPKARQIDLLLVLAVYGSRLLVFEKDYFELD